MSLKSWAMALVGVPSLAKRLCSRRIPITHTRSDSESPTIMAGFSNLPPELILNVMDNLDFKTLIQCMQVSQFFHATIKESASFQYKLQLAVNGMEDGLGGPMVPAERLALLKRHQDAWDNLQYTSQLDVTMEMGSVWELSGGVLAQGKGSRSLVVHQLPSDLRGIPDESWVLEDIGIPIRDFTMDPSQDLLVLVEDHIQGLGQVSRFHLRSLRTGKPHPFAPSTPFLSHEANVLPISYTLQLSGDHLAVIIFPQDTLDLELRVWNWKTGELQLALEDPTMSSMAFLSHRHLLISHIRLDDEVKREPVLTVVDFTAATKDLTLLKDADFVCALHGPIMKESSSTLGVLLRSDPGPSWTPDPKLRVPFYIARQDRLFVLTAWMMAQFSLRTTVFLVPSYTVMQQVEVSQSPQAKRHIPWQAWGPSGSRLLSAPASFSRTWVCYVYGMKFVTSQRVNVDEDTAVQSIKLHDFNRYAVKKALQNGDGEREGDKGMECVIGTSTFPRGGELFKTPAETSLPYRYREIVPPVRETRFSAAMVSEDSLLMVADRGPEVREYRVLTF